RDLAEGTDVRQARRAIAGLEPSLVLGMLLQPRDDLARLLERPGVRVFGDLAQGWDVGLDRGHRWFSGRDTKNHTPWRQSKRLRCNRSTAKFRCGVEPSCPFRKRKCPRGHRLYRAHGRAPRTEVKAIFSFEPSPESAVMMATDMPAAISAYSMAVAPLSSRAKRARSLFMSPELQRPFGMAASQSLAR